jgi:hypothetical protein
LHRSFARQRSGSSQDLTFDANKPCSALLPYGSRTISPSRFATRSIISINFHKGPVRDLLEPVWASWGLSSRLDKNETTRSLVYIPPIGDKMREWEVGNAQGLLR